VRVVHDGARAGVRRGVRLTLEAKRTLNIAASAAGRSVSEFVLESALSRAEEMIDAPQFVEPVRSAEKRDALQNDRAISASELFVLVPPAGCSAH
jgi:uncharacterized protein (DUF1778 family)